MSVSRAIEYIREAKNRAIHPGEGPLVYAALCNAQDELEGVRIIEVVIEAKYQEQEAKQG